MQTPDKHLLSPTPERSPLQLSAPPAPSRGTLSTPEGVGVSRKPPPPAHVNTEGASGECGGWVVVEQAFCPCIRGAWADNQDLQLQLCT